MPSPAWVPASRTSRCPTSPTSASAPPGRSRRCSCRTCCRRSSSAPCSARSSIASAGGPARSSRTSLRCIAFVVVMTADSLPIMIAGACLSGVGTAMFTPAALAGLPRLLNRNDTRAAGMGLYSAIDDLGLTAGPALAAVLLAVISPTTLMGLNAATYAISAILIATIVTRDVAPVIRARNESLRRRPRRRPRTRFPPGDPRPARLLRRRRALHRHHQRRRGRARPRGPARRRLGTGGDGHRGRPRHPARLALRPLHHRRRSGCGAAPT